MAENNGFPVYRSAPDSIICSSCEYWGAERGFDFEYMEYAVYTHNTVCKHPEQSGMPIRARHACRRWTKVIEKDPRELFQEAVEAIREDTKR